MTAIVYTHTIRNYGNDQTYISDPNIAVAVERLTGRKTLTPSDGWALQQVGDALGLQIEFVEGIRPQLTG